MMDGADAPTVIISIHPPRGGWDKAYVLDVVYTQISIHPPRGGWDRCPKCLYVQRIEFQSTHPVGGGTLMEV